MELRLIAGIALGIAVGVISGLIGVGGGIVLVPALIFAFKMDQHLAQGTSLAMLLPPTGMLAFLRYYRAGHADLKLGLFLALGVFVGGYFGGKWAQDISGLTLRRIFALVLVATAVKLFFQK
ncbi:MAG: sulfite exporter TauE/SafE family protein [Acidobacteria bacterium]|nr:sulfite exporter TauE/SafE family protein [Acidobacteriota bacterium]